MIESVQAKLNTAFSPSHLEVINESHMHRTVPGAETHLKVIIVSEQFTGKRSVSRHQLVYGELSQELAGELHALALHTYTADEWLQENKIAPESPRCAGHPKS